MGQVYVIGQSMLILCSCEDPYHTRASNCIEKDQALLRRGDNIMIEETKKMMQILRQII